MLHSLEIKNFRLLEDFTVEKLGRVNLIVGKNNSGKSTVLEALRIYAGNANLDLLNKIAINHEENYLHENTKFNESDLLKPFEELFTGRMFPDDETTILIGDSTNNSDTLKIWHGFEVIEKKEFIDANGKKINTESSSFNLISSSTDPSGSYVTSSSYFKNIKNSNEFAHGGEVLLVSKNNIAFPIHLSARYLFSNAIHTHFLYLNFVFIPCGFIPTQFISVDELAKEWDSIVFTENEEIIKQALHIILPEFENLAFVGEQSKRTAKVKLSNLPRPVPLKSLGDGMIRVLQLALKLVSAKNGFLLIDEFENGLHYSTQEKIWALLFEMSERLNIQIFATTHSWDCIEAFTKVAIENETTEGVLFRMGKSAKKSNQGQVIATVFDKERLYNLTQADIEIR
ncbi:AAA family ATPase [Methylosoma difficile]